MASTVLMGLPSAIAAHAAGHDEPLGEGVAHGIISWLLSRLLPSPVALVWLLTGFAAGVVTGCFGAAALRPCAALHAIPVLLAVAALYAVAYLS